MTARAAFLCDLRRALARLYDPAKLRSSPLARVFGVDQRQDTAAALQRILVEGVEALKPGPHIPPAANAWRTYNVLAQRYAEHLTQREVSADLGLSIRQLRREENLALRMLADYLSARYDLQFKAHYASAASVEGDEGALAGPGAPTRKEEIEWLKRSLPSEPVDVAEVVQVVLRTVAPLMQAVQVRAECVLPENLPRLAVQLTSMRQALLSIVTAAIRSVPGGRIRIEAGRHRRDVCLYIQPSKPQATPAALLAEDYESLEMARELVGLSGGTLDVISGERGRQPFTARLVLPAAEQVSVLVIDDNADTLHLLERYLAGTRYRFAAAPDPQQALAVAEELAPEVVVLDVMLPGVDGWELLGRLREHPKTRRTAVVVCTILPQEQLALTLGAAAFLRKPVSRPALIETLDRLLEPPAKEAG